MKMSYTKKTTQQSILVAASSALLWIGVLVFISAEPAYAQFNNPLNTNSLAALLVQIVNALILILFPIVVLMIVLTGFLFVSAQGEPAKLQRARQAFFWTVIGALIVLGAKALALAVCATVQNLGAAVNCSVFP